MTWHVLSACDIGKARLSRGSTRWTGCTVFLILWEKKSFTSTAAPYMIQYDMERMLVKKVMENGTDEKLCQEQRLSLQPLLHKGSVITNSAIQGWRLDGLNF